MERGEGRGKRGTYHVLCCWFLVSLCRYNTTAPRSTTQHYAASRSTTQHYAALRSITQHHAASRRVTCSQPIPFYNLTTIIHYIYAMSHPASIASHIFLSTHPCAAQYRHHHLMPKAKPQDSKPPLTPVPLATGGKRGKEPAKEKEKEKETGKGKGKGKATEVEPPKVEEKVSLSSISLLFLFR